MPEEGPEESAEPELEEGIEEKDVNELESADIAVAPATPLVVCQEDSELMEVEGADVREVEGRGGFLGFGSSEEFHTHLKYKCSTCGKYYYHDVEAKRQGCFIATAAYGTPLAKEINVLRRFRDSYLEHRNWGKKLVNLYYTLSPPIANIIEKSETLKKIVRTCLQPLVDLFKKKYKESETCQE
ncbi:hypothetical protein AKJ49_00455 [candidate division MSBL1 archaeon SCGC-AAA382A03]|uniref:Uncharacterized protein n=1 Tax=candidate division MSBL1 archaeon SCGC-AAA382A03 TaxID=1698278 RepID=A0A133VGK7_9EURY|nr:hypothetical protein AKJ49_00455 [candidate division MSBL1 archaeon SCGC-AAA382A03]